MRRFVLVVGLLLGACRPDATTIDALPTHVRFVNAMVGTDGTGPALDMMLDGSVEPPGAPALAAGAATPLMETLEGVHAFTASPTAGGPDNIFSYVARQYLTPGVTYTLVAAGVMGAGGQPVSADPLFLIDDPYVPPTIDGVLQARFKFINAAPFANASGSGATVRVIATPGTDPPSSVAGLSNVLSRGYMNRFPAYANVDPGPWVLTFAAGNTILAHLPVTLGGGEVHTYVLYNTGPPTGGTPGPQNHAVLDLVDRN